MKSTNCFLMKTLIGQQELCGCLDWLDLYKCLACPKIYLNDFMLHYIKTFKQTKRLMLSRFNYGIVYKISKLYKYKYYNVLIKKIGHRLDY